MLTAPWWRDSTRKPAEDVAFFFLRKIMHAWRKTPTTCGTVFSGDGGTQPYVMSVRNGIYGGEAVHRFSFPFHIQPEE